MPPGFGDHWRDLLNIVAFAVTTGGFTLALWQIRKVRTAAEAAQAATQRALDSLAMRQLLVLVAGQERLEDELDRAVAVDDRAECTRILARWRRGANELSGLLQLDPARAYADAIVTKLVDSVVVVVTARDKLASSQRTTEQITRAARDAIADACNEMGRAKARLMREVETHG